MKALARLLLAFIVMLPTLVSLGAVASSAAAQTAETEASAQSDDADASDSDAGSESDRDAEIDSLPFDPKAGVVDVVQVSGLIDPVLADFVIDRVQDADPRVRAVVLQVNSQGSVVDSGELNRLATAIVEAKVPVAIWVGPSNARALGPWVELASLADRVGIAPGARFGNSGDRQLDDSFAADWGAAGSLIVNDTISSDQALELGIATVEGGFLGEFLVGIEDLGIDTTVVGDGEEARTVALTQVRFQRLSLLAQQLHTVASPPVAYLLFTIGMALIVFEFYTAGVGVAGVVGAGMFVLGCFGLFILPTNLFAVALLVVSMLAYSVDVQTGVPRFWTIVGTLALIVGTILLYRDGVSMSWIPMVVGIVGITLMMVTGMPTMVRTRFSTPTIGREWMIGELGEAVEAVDPDGLVTIDGALWKARTNRATPLRAGQRVRVAAVEGLVLEVEPEDGAARDYRERRGRDHAE